MKNIILYQTQYFHNQQREITELIIAYTLVNLKAHYNFIHFLISSFIKEINPHQYFCNTMKQNNLFQQSMDDVLMDMKMGTKQLNRQANKSEKQTMHNLKSAKDQLRKNNEDGAKLYCQNAAFKKTQVTNLQKMAAKNQFLAVNMKSLQNNQTLMNSYEKMGNIAKNMNPNFEQMAYNMNNLDQAMTNMQVNQKMMTEMMNQQSSSNDSMTDQMLRVLKQQVAYEDKAKLEQAAQLKQQQNKIQSMKTRNVNLQF